MGHPDMGKLAAERQEPPSGGPLAAFDFDGTLTSHDSFLAFLAWRAGRVGYAFSIAWLAPDLLAWLRHRDRGRLKAAVVREFLAGATRAQLDADAERFAGQRGRTLLRSDAVRVWRRWQNLGASLVIVTASPEFIVAPMARALGADHLIGTRLAFDSAGRATGALDGLNCRGPEKVRRLREVFGDDVRLAAAYGDSEGDADMLAIAHEQGMRVFTGSGGTFSP